MAKSFRCSLVTPEALMFEEDVTYANLPAHDGQLGIMANHAPLVVQLGEGTLELTTLKGGQQRYHLAGGFAQMNANRLTLVSEKASSAK